MKAFKDTTRTTYSCGHGAKGPGLKGAAATGHALKTYKTGGDKAPVFRKAPIGAGKR